MSGGGITFSNLFQGWPADRLATVHNDPEPVSDDVCSLYYRLGAREVDLAFPFNKLRQATQGGASDGSGGDLAVHATNRESLARRAAVAILGDRLPERACLTPELENWIAEYRPELIYTILGTGGLMDLIEQIRVRFNLPMAVHVMDDWLSTPGKGLLGRQETNRTGRQARHFFQAATLRMGISPAMCSAYEERYQTSFQAFQNTIDVEKWSAFARPAMPAGSPADILYVGSIFPNAQLDSLIDACKAVARLNQEGTSATLTIASPAAQATRYRHLLAIDPAIHIVDTIRDDETFFQRIATADLLLLPVNFDDETQRYIRYSMPTKVPAYLASGTPILAYGPSGIAQIEYARESGWALVVDQQGIEGLGMSMKRLLEENDLRNRLNASAHDCALRNHDSSIVRRDFQAALCNAAGNIRKEQAQ